MEIVCLPNSRWIKMMATSKRHDHRRIPLTKASDAEQWYFLWSVPEQTIEWTIETPGIWDAIAIIMTSL